MPSESELNHLVGQSILVDRPNSLESIIIIIDTDNLMKKIKV